MDMSFSAEEIAGMLKDYEEDHATGMDIGRMAELIYEHTSGYPFLVSKICKLIDEDVAGSEGFPDLKAAWTYGGFLEADRLLLGEKNTLFESMANKLYDLPELKEMVYSIISQADYQRRRKYYIESRTRNMERTDVIVDYHGEQMVIEMKIWRGNAYHERGEKQLMEYLDHYHLNKGYMVSFNFNKNKKTGVNRIALDGKVLVEAVV